MDNVNGSSKRESLYLFTFLRNQILIILKNICKNQENGYAIFLNLKQFYHKFEILNLKVKRLKTTNFELCIIAETEEPTFVE